MLRHIVTGIQAGITPAAGMRRASTQAPPVCTVVPRSAARGWPGACTGHPRSKAQTLGTRWRCRLRCRTAQRCRGPCAASVGAEGQRCELPRQVSVVWPRGVCWAGRVQWLGCVRVSFRLVAGQVALLPGHGSFSFSSGRQMMPKPTIRQQSGAYCNVPELLQ